MSQLQFQVSIVGANSSTKAVVPASAPNPVVASSSSPTTSGGKSNSNVFVSSQVQLPCSPIAPARIILKNTEKYPIYFKVFTDRKSTSSTAMTSNNNSDSNNNNNQDSAFEEALFIHPTRGAVKPNKSITIAVVLAPPPNPLEKILQRNSAGTSSSSSSVQRKRSQTPKKVSFAPDDDDNEGGDEDNKNGSEYDPENNNNNDNNNNNNNQKRNGIVCRMKIEAVVILSGNTNQNFNTTATNSTGSNANQDHFLHNHDHDDENVATSEAVEMTQQQQQNQNKNHHHMTNKHFLISKQEFDRQWTQGVQIPSRVFDIVSVRPVVTRDQYLHYLVTRKLQRCERLAHRCESYQNQCATILRQIEDLKEADVIERTKELERYSNNNNNNNSQGGDGYNDAIGDSSSTSADAVAANFHFFAFVIGVVASFVAGFTL